MESWSQLRRHASESLPPDLSRRVLERVGVIRRRRRDLLAACATVAICLASTFSAVWWNAYRQNQVNLSRWQELSEVTVAVDRGL